MAEGRLEAAAAAFRPEWAALIDCPTDELRAALAALLDAARADVDRCIRCTCDSGHDHATLEGRAFCEAMRGPTR